MRAKLERGIAHYAARRIAGRSIARFGLLRFLPSGLLAMLLAEGLLLAVRELRARPDLRKTLWRSLSEGMSRKLPIR